MRDAWFGCVASDAYHHVCVNAFSTCSGDYVYNSRLRVAKRCSIAATTSTSDVLGALHVLANGSWLLGRTNPKFVGKSRSINEVRPSPSAPGVSKASRWKAPFQTAPTAPIASFDLASGTTSIGTLLIAPSQPAQRRCVQRTLDALNLRVGSRLCQICEGRQ